jgi:hypothetical protein
MLKITLLAAGGLGAVLPAAAQQKKVDFDSGKDDTGIIAQVKKEGSLRYANPLRTLDARSTLPAGLVPAKKGSVHKRSAHVVERGLDLPSSVPCDSYPPSADDPGGATPDFCGSGAAGRSSAQRKAASATTYASWVESNSDYAEALSLKSQLEGGGVGFRSGGVSSLASVPGAGPILDRWPPIASQHGTYLNQAGLLDGQGDSFSAFTARLNNWGGKIQARLDEAKTDTDQYNAACLGRPLPPDEYQACNAYKAGFDQCVSAHNASQQQFQSLVQIWNNNKQCLQSSGDSFVKTFLDWITSVVKPWASDAKKALQDDSDCAVGKISLQPNNGTWALHCPYTCKSYSGQCGLAGAFDHEPTFGEIMALCPDFSRRPPVLCPAPF